MPESLQMKCVDKNEFREYDRSPLEVDRLPAIIFQIEDLQHLRVYQLSTLWQDPFEVGKEWRIV